MSLRKHSVATDVERKAERIEFARRSDAIRKQLKAMERCVIKPQGKFIQLWDKVTTCALVFTAFVTPWEVGLLPSGFWEPQSISIPLFTINRIVDSVFLFDIMIQFFIPFRSKEGLWIFKNEPLAWHYLTTWFPIDFMSSIPYDSIFLGFQALVADANDGTAGSGGSGLRMLKMLRLLKLGRILRASRILKRWEAYIGMSHASLELIKFLIISLIIAHWLACLWAFIGKSGDYLTPLAEDPEWLARYPGVPYIYQRDYRSHTWIQKAGLGDSHPFELYGVALYVSLSNMFGGPTDISPANYVEFYVQCLMMLIGSCTWAYIISAGCGIIATLNPQGVEFRQTMDQLNYFSRDMNLPQALTIKLRTFFQNTQHIIFARHYDGLMEKMSPLLRGEAALRVANKSLKRLPFFRMESVEEEFLASAALSMRVAIYSIREYLPSDHLTIIERGIAAKEGRLKIKGTSFGFDMVIGQPRLRDWAPVVALTVVVQVMYLSRPDLDNILQNDTPKAREALRMAAVRIAMQRLTLRVADEFKRRRSATGQTPTMKEATELALARASAELAIREQRATDENRGRGYITGVEDTAKNADKLQGISQPLAKVRRVKRGNIEEDVAALRNDLEGLKSRMDSQLAELTHELRALPAKIIEASTASKFAARSRVLGKEKSRPKQRCQLAAASTMPATTFAASPDFEHDHMRAVGNGKIATASSGTAGEHLQA